MYDDYDAYGSYGGYGGLYSDDSDEEDTYSAENLNYLPLDGHTISKSFVAKMPGLKFIALNMRSQVKDEEAMQAGAYPEEHHMRYELAVVRDGRKREVKLVDQYSETDEN